jgi:integrase
VAQIRKRGSSQYQARVRLKGYPEQTKTFQLKQDAVSWANERERLVLRGNSSAMREADNVTLHDALERYSREVTPSKKGWQQELCRLRRWQKNPLSALPLSQIRGADLARYRDSRMDTGIGGNTVRLELALISHLYEVARKDWGYEMLGNPAKAMRKPKLPRGRDRRLFMGEEQRLLDHCDRIGNTLLKAIIILAIETAMRRGELTNLTWSDINLDNRLAYLHDTKNGEARIVPLSTRALSAIQSIPRRSSALLVSVHRDNVSAAFASVCKACGIHGLRLHDLRHEATSRLFEKGFNMMEVATITGHKSLSMLKRYTHLRPSDLLSRLG